MESSSTRINGLSAVDRVPRSSSTLIGADGDPAAAASRFSSAGVIAMFSVRLRPSTIGTCVASSRPQAAVQPLNTSAADSGSTLMFHSDTGVVLPR